MKSLILLLVVLLVGCGWDMRVESWAAAVELCEPFGGVKAADEAALSSGGHRVDAKRASGVTVRAVIK